MLKTMWSWLTESKSDRTLREFQAQVEQINQRVTLMLAKLELQDKIATIKLRRDIAAARLTNRNN